MVWEPRLSLKKRFLNPGKEQLRPFTKVVSNSKLMRLIAGGLMLDCCILKALLPLSLAQQLVSKPELSLLDLIHSPPKTSPPPGPSAAHGF